MQAPRQPTKSQRGLRDPARFGAVFRTRRHVCGMLAIEPCRGSKPMFDMRRRGLESRRALFRRLFGSLLVSGAMAFSAAAENAPGVTDREIKIGQTMPYTGPVGWISSIAVTE